MKIGERYIGAKLRAGKESTRVAQAWEEQLYVSVCVSLFRNINPGGQAYSHLNHNGYIIMSRINVDAIAQDAVEKAITLMFETIENEMRSEKCQRLRYSQLTPCIVGRLILLLESL